DADTGVAANAAFALGLMRDPAALPKLRAMVIDESGRTPAVVQVEAAAAISRIGGPDAARILSDLLTRWSSGAGLSAVPPAAVEALGDAWRLAGDAPVAAILAFADSPDPNVRWRAIYSVGRLKAQAAADVLLAATEDS